MQWVNTNRYDFVNYLCVIFFYNSLAQRTTECVKYSTQAMLKYPGFRDEILKRKISKETNSEKKREESSKENVRTFRTSFLVFFSDFVFFEISFFEISTTNPLNTQITHKKENKWHFKCHIWISLILTYSTKEFSIKAVRNYSISSQDECM